MFDWIWQESFVSADDECAHTPHTGKPWYMRFLYYLWNYKHFFDDATFTSRCTRCAETIHCPAAVLVCTISKLCAFIPAYAVVLPIFLATKGSFWPVVCVFFAIVFGVFLGWVAIPRIAISLAFTFCHWRTVNLCAMESWLFWDLREKRVARLKRITIQIAWTIAVFGAVFISYIVNYVL